MPDVLVDVAREFRAAYEGAGFSRRGEVMEEYCLMFGWSRQKAFNTLKSAGWSSGRKPRADKGVVQCGLSEKDIELAGKLILNSKRKTDKIIMSTDKAIEILEDNGVIGRGQVSPATLNRLMRERRIARTNLLAPESTVQLRSLHPNHVHQLDSSVCIQYDFGKKGRLMDRNMQMEFYKNKPGYWKTVKKVLLRYLLTDHYTGSFFAHYYYVSGENSTSLLDFTLKAWGKKEEPSKYPFHGVPLILMVDKGSANLSAVYNSFCSNLGVELLDHVPGRANVNGQVEGMHAFWERAFESELSLLKAENLDELNARALDYAMYLNALKIHKRTKASRSGFWASMIRKDQLRELPPIEICRTLATTQPYTAVVQANKLITFKLPGAASAQTYQLTGPFQKKDKVTVVIRPYDLVDGIPNIEVSDKNRELFPCKLITFDAGGYKADGPVIGESYARHEFNPAERFKADFKAEGKESIKEIKPQIQRPKLDKIDFFIKEGEEVVVKTPAPVLPVSAYDARKRIREALGLDRFTTLQSQLIDRKLTQEVIDESELETLIEEFKTRFGGASTISAIGEKRKEAKG